MNSWARTRLETLGFTTETLDLGIHTINGEKSQVPPAILATHGNDAAKKTVLIYGHLDVQPAKMEEGWDTEPFKLTNIRGSLHGRGATDDKGPVLAWLNAIEAYAQTGMDLPLNIKAIFECVEECGSLGLADALKSVKDNFISNVDVVAISDTNWLGPNKPCLGYGTRGMVYFTVEVEGGTKDLHSGSFGGAV